MKKKIIKNIFYILEDGTKGCEDICIELNIPKEIKKQRREERAHDILASVGSEMAKTSIVVGLSVPSAIWLAGMTSIIPEEHKVTRTVTRTGGAILFGIGHACLAEAIGNKLFAKDLIYEKRNYTYDRYIDNCTHRMVESYYDAKFGKGKYILLTKDCWEMMDKTESIQGLFKLLNKEESKDDDTGDT